MASLTLVLAGFGTVGREFARLLLERRGEAGRAGVELRVVGVVDSRGAAVDCNGLPADTISKLLGAPRGQVSSVAPQGKPGATVEDVVEMCNPDILVDATPSRYEGEPPQLRWALKVLRSGGAVVFADKAPMATACHRLLGGGWSWRVYYKATVMAGTPLIDLLRYGMLGRRVESVRGALNGTCNYVLWLAEKGYDYGEAVKRAQEEGYAEPDPTLDLKGFDLAAKAAIISCTLGSPVTVWDVRVRSIVDEDAARRAREAARAGRRLRYIATVKPGSRPEVALVEVTVDTPLYEGVGVENVAVIETEEAPPVTVRGPGAGPRATAASLLSDTLHAALRLSGVL